MQAPHIKQQQRTLECTASELNNNMSASTSSATSPVKGLHTSCPLLFTHSETTSLKQRTKRDGGVVSRLFVKRLLEKGCAVGHSALAQVPALDFAAPGLATLLC